MLLIAIMLPVSADGMLVEENALQEEEAVAQQQESTIAAAERERHPPSIGAEGEGHEATPTQATVSESTISELSPDNEGHQPIPAVDSGDLQELSCASGPRGLRAGRRLWGNTDPCTRAQKASINRLKEAMRTRERYLPEHGISRHELALHRENAAMIIPPIDDGDTYQQVLDKSERMRTKQESIHALGKIDIKRRVPQEILHEFDTTAAGMDREFNDWRDRNRPCKLDICKEALK